MRPANQHRAACHGSGDGVSLSVGNYAAIASKPVTTDEALIDVFSYRSADLALVGGCVGYEGDGTQGPLQRPDFGDEGGCGRFDRGVGDGLQAADLPYLAMGEKRASGLGPRLKSGPVATKSRKRGGNSRSRPDGARAKRRNRHRPGSVLPCVFPGMDPANLQRSCSL